MTQQQALGPLVVCLPMIGSLEYSSANSNRELFLDEADFWVWGTGGISGL
jgi:hypothetical protein